MSDNSIYRYLNFFRGWNEGSLGRARIRLETLFNLNVVLQAQIHFIRSSGCVGSSSFEPPEQTKEHGKRERLLEQQC